MKQERAPRSLIASLATSGTAILGGSAFYPAAFHDARPRDRCEPIVRRDGGASGRKKSLVLTVCHRHVSSSAPLSSNAQPLLYTKSCPHPGNPTTKSSAAASR